MPQPLRKSDVQDADFVDAYELASDGLAATPSAVYLTTTGVSTTNLTSTVVSQLPADGEGLKTSADHPVQVGDLLVIAGSSPAGIADGQYTVATVVNDTSVTVVEVIPNSTGGILTWVYPAGASRVGFNPAGQEVTSATTVGQALVDIANAISVAAGGMVCIRFALGTGTSQTSLSSIPAGAIVTKAYLDIQTAYPPGTMMQVGRAGAPNLLMDTSDNDPTFEDQYEADQDTPWGGLNFPVLVTVIGSPAYGSGDCVVTYALPNP
jgi:hypothetical protein